MSSPASAPESAPAAETTKAAAPPLPMGWLVLLGVIVAWWIRDLAEHWSSQPEYEFGWIVVMLVAYLTWERWPTRPRDDSPVSLGRTLIYLVPGALIVLVSEFHRVGIARTASSSCALSVGCTLFSIAIILLAFGPKTLRLLLFPLLFFFVAVPIPKLVWNPVVLSLQSVVTLIDVEILNLIGIPATQDAHVIRLPNASVGVDEACSGIRSLQSSVMAALFIGDLTLRRSGSKVFFLFAGVVLSMIGNVIRSVFLAVTAANRGTEALHAVHDTAGWSVFLFSVTGIAILAALVNRTERRIEAREKGVVTP